MRGRRELGTNRGRGLPRCGSERDRGRKSKKVKLIRTDPHDGDKDRQGSR